MGNRKRLACLHPRTAFVDFVQGRWEDKAAWVSGALFGEDVEKTSKSLLIRARDGEEAAWQRIVDLYQPMIQNWLYRQAIQRQEADDLTQDVLALAIKNLKNVSHSVLAGPFRNG